MGLQQARQRGRRSLVAAAVAVFVVLVAGEVSSSCGGLKVSVNKINLSLPSIRADLSPSILHFRWDSLSTIPVSSFMVMNSAAGVANQAICAAALSFFTGPVSIQDPISVFITAHLQATTATRPASPPRPRHQVHQRPQSSSLATAGIHRANFSPFGATVQPHLPREDARRLRAR